MLRSVAVIALCIATLFASAQEVQPVSKVLGFAQVPAEMALAVSKAIVSRNLAVQSSVLPSMQSAAPHWLTVEAEDNNVSNIMQYIEEVVPGAKVVFSPLTSAVSDMMRLLTPPAQQRTTEQNRSEVQIVDLGAPSGYDTYYVTTPYDNPIVFLVVGTPGTGYSWEVNPDRTSPSLTYGPMEVFEPATTPGGPVVYRFVVVPKAIGAYRLRLEYKRPFEEQTPAVAVKQITFHIY